jgi:hypothetical protein
MVKVGDRVEVMTNGLCVPKGTILTVTKPMNSANIFCTNDPSGKGTNGELGFLDTHLIGGTLRLLSTTQTQPVFTQGPNPNQAAQVGFKVGDVTEWYGGEQWEIIGENATEFELKMVKVATSSLGLVPGTICWYPKADIGNYAKVVLATSLQPSATTLNGYVQKMDFVDVKITIGSPKCCCGAASCKDFLHSTWCDAYEPVWKET